MATTLRTETEDGVCSIVLTRAREYNTITPALRDELAEAIDLADRDPEVRVILLRAEGPAFCAGYGLDWSTRPPEREPERAWDTVQDMAMMGRFVETYMKLWYAKKPTIAAVQGWCIGGGTDMVLCADIIIAGEGASFGYPPSRVWGTPTTAMWVYRMGIEKAKRYLLTGDEIPARRAAEIGLILEVVPDGELQSHALAFAKRMAREPVDHAEAAVQPDGGEHGVRVEPAARHDLRRCRPPHAGGAGLRGPRPGGGLPAGRPRTRRPLR